MDFKSSASTFWPQLLFFVFRVNKFQLKTLNWFFLQAAQNVYNVKINVNQVIFYQLYINILLITIIAGLIELRV